MAASFKIQIKNLNLSLKNGGTPILSNINAKAFPNRILAIMAKSGEGKTSLLNVLAGRIDLKEYELSGEIKINGHHKIRNTFFRKKIAFVPQNDFLYETLTIRETLELASHLKNDQSLSNKEKRAISNSAISQLKLTSCAETLVGNASRKGVSGGEKKRTSLGVALMTNPEIFLVDEPTTGLDSESAFKIVRILKDIAAKGKTVVLTIHQPNTEIFNLLDDLLILSNSTVVYNGPSASATAFFSRLGHPCPVTSNPADYFLDVVHIEKGSAEDIDRVQAITAEYKSSLKDFGQTSFEMKETFEKTFAEEKGSPKNIGLLGQTWLLTRSRTLKHYYRNPSTAVMRLLTTVFSALLIGGFFYGIGKRTKNFEVAKNTLFFITLDLLFNTVFSVVLNFPKEKHVFLNETSNSMYSPVSFYTSKLLIEIPIQSVFVFAYLAIALSMTKLTRSFSEFLSIAAIVNLGCLVGYSFTFVISIFADAVENSLSVVSLFFIPASLFSGFYINASDIRVWLRWLTFANFYRYYLDLLFYASFRDNAAALNSLGIRNLKVLAWTLILVSILLGGLLFNGGALYFKSKRNVRRPLILKEA